MDQLVRVQNFTVSSDGFGAGEQQTLERPFGHADPGEMVLEQARDAAGGQDVRLGGGATVIRQFLRADLVDTLHVAVSPVRLGSGVRLWQSPDELRDRFHLDVVPSPSGVTHHLFWRR